MVLVWEIGHISQPDALSLARALGVATGAVVTFDGNPRSCVIMMMTFGQAQNVAISRINCAIE